MTFVPPTPQFVSIPGPSGMLEAVVDEPEQAQPQYMGVVCHPHPLQGGTMTNKVVHMLARSCNECGAPTVRFNYRGVGNSDGSYDEGRGETDDALAVIEWARIRWPEAQLWLAGFSFGGGVACRAAMSAQPRRLITVAPAIARAPPAQLPHCPWLVIQGDSDDVIPASLVTSWIDALSVKPELKIVPGAGHFFHGKLGELRSIARDWLSQS